jgi:hypothetical protein
VLRAEQRGERDARRARDQIDRAFSLARSSRLIRQQADPLAAQPREVLGSQDVDAGQRRRL